MGNHQNYLGNLNRRDFLLASFSAAVGSLVLSGCDRDSKGIFGPTPDPFPYRAPGDQAINLVASTKQPRDILISLPRGATTDWKLLEQNASNLLREHRAIEGEIRIIDERLPAVSPGAGMAAPEMDAAILDLKGSVGSYFYRISAETGYIGGCIRKQGVPHVGLLLKDKLTGRQIVNLHLCSWIENGRRCLGIYNSANGWCQKICAPTSKQRQDLLKSALMAVGVAGVIAAAVALVLMPMIAPVLLLA